MLEELHAATSLFSSSSGLLLLPRRCRSPGGGEALGGWVCHIHTGSLARAHTHTQCSQLSSCLCLLL